MGDYIDKLFEAYDKLDQFKKQGADFLRVGSQWMIDTGKAGLEAADKLDPSNGQVQALSTEDTEKLELLLSKCEKDMSEPHTAAIPPWFLTFLPILIDIVREILKKRRGQ